MDPRAHPTGPAPRRAARLRDLGPLPEGRDLAQRDPAPRRPPAVLRTHARRLRARLLVGDPAARACRVGDGGRSQGLDARPDRRGGAACVRGRLAAARGARDAAPGPALGAPAAGQLPGERPRHAARRRQLSVGRAAGRQLALAPGAGKRRLPARARRPARGRGGGAPPDRRSGPPAGEDRRRPRRPRTLARGRRAARGAARGAPRARAAPARLLQRARGPRPHPRLSRAGTAGVPCRALVGRRDGGARRHRARRRRLPRRSSRRGRSRSKAARRSPTRSAASSAGRSCSRSRRRTSSSPR